MGDALIDELIGRGAASRGQVEEAKRRMAASGGRFVEALIEVGCSPDRLLSTLSATTGIPAAPRSALARPIVPVGLGVDGATWRDLGAVPFGTDEDGDVLIAIADPMVQQQLAAFDLPDFKLHLAVPAELSSSLERAFPAAAENALASTLPVQALGVARVDQLPAGHDLPTAPIRALKEPGDGAFDGVPSTSADPAPEATVDSRRGKTGKFGLPEVDLKGVDGDADFDGPTQAVDPSALAPFKPAIDERLPTRAGEPVEAAVAPAGAPAGAPADAPAGDDEEYDDYGDGDVKTLAMSAKELRESIKARIAAQGAGAVAATEPPRGASAEAKAPATDPEAFVKPPPSSPELEVEEEDFAPKTIAMTLDEMRASLAARGVMSQASQASQQSGDVVVTTKKTVVFEDTERLPQHRVTRSEEPEPGLELEHEALSEETRAPEDRSFDYSDAADGFDDGEGRADVATDPHTPLVQSGGDAPVAPRHDEVGEDDVLFIDEATGRRRAAELLRTSPDDGDDAEGFDEETVAADLLAKEAPQTALAKLPPPAAAPRVADRSGERSAVPTADDDIHSIDDDDVVAFVDDQDVVPAAFDEQTFVPEGGLQPDVEVLAVARTRMHGTPPIVDDDASVDDSGVFGGSGDEASVEAVPDREMTEAGADPVDETKMASAGGGSKDVGNLPTASIPMRAEPRPKPGKKSVDTAPTGPIAVRGYDVKEVLGAGGMATVYRATQRSAGRDVALKILSPHLSNDAAFVARFQREIRSCASLTHQNIIRVFDFGDEAGVYYMATEIMDGGSLRDALGDHGRLPVALAVKMLEHLLKGIGHAHKRGMVHRDIKPANLMLSSDGLLKLGDFGIAKSETDENLTRTGALFGTPAYMSPEQALGKTVDSRSDLFSCGILFYEMLAGDNPYQADTASAALLKVSRANPPSLLLANPAVPPLALEVLARLQQREATDRYQTAEDAVRDLAPLIDSVDESWPNLVQDYVASPSATVSTLLAGHAERELMRARHHITRDPPEAFASAIACYLASVIDPDNVDARRMLSRLSDENNLSFGVSSDTRVHDAERALDDDPRAPGLLRRISDLYRAGGNPFKAALWLRQYLVVKPTDSHAANQLLHLVGSSKLAGFDDWSSAPRTWEPPSDLNWNKLARPGDESVEGPDVSDVTQVPEQSAVSSQLSQPDEVSASALDLRPLGFPMPQGPTPPVPARPAPEAPAGDVRPAISLNDPGEMLRAATQRARGLQVLKVDAPPSPPEPAPAPPPFALTPLAAPELIVHQPTAALPRAASKKNDAAPGGLAVVLKRLPPKLLLAAGGVVALLLVAVVVLFVGLGGDELRDAVRAVDPGDDAPVEVRQEAMLKLALEKLQAGDGPLALVAAEMALELGEATPTAGSALIVRGRAYASVGNPGAAKRDFAAVMGRYPGTNLLYLEAKQRLKELPE